jgi:hypothetical protein
LEKDPEQRFQSVRDLAFDLAAIDNVSAASQAPRSLVAQDQALDSLVKAVEAAPLK